MFNLTRVQDHDILLEGIFDGWNCSSVVLKPSVHSSGMGHIRIATVDDLVIATKAMREGAPKVALHKLSMQPEGATLPLSLPELMVVEPWMETDPVVFSSAAADDAGVQWEGKSRWVEVSVGLLGELVSVWSVLLCIFACTGGRLCMDRASAGFAGLSVCKVCDSCGRHEHASVAADCRAKPQCVLGSQQCQRRLRLQGYCSRRCHSLALLRTTVCCSFICPQGSMIALQPTLIASGVGGSRHQLTPAPEHILPQAAVEAAQVSSAWKVWCGKCFCM